MNDAQTEINARVAQALGDAMIRNIALTVQIEALMAEKAKAEKPLPEKEEK
jgi:hypothetical protein